jgi:hypothetical protein
MNDTEGSMLEAHLQPDEQILWRGQPNPRRIARSYILSGWATVALVGVILALFGVDILLLALFSLVLVVIIALMGATWIYPDARRTRYVLTDRRALVLNARRQTSPQQFTRDDVEAVKHIHHRDGSGDMLFVGQDSRPGGIRRKTRYPGFIGLDDAAILEPLLMQTFGPATSTAHPPEPPDPPEQKDTPEPSEQKDTPDAEHKPPR